MIGLIKKVTLELRLEGGEAVNHTATEGRMLQAEGAVSTKSLRPGARG